MRPSITTLFTALALTTIAAASAFAQNGPPTGRSANDGGLVGEPNQAQAPQHAGGMMGPAQETSGCARIHSFDPANNTYMGKDGRRHSCQM
jgi:BA14K-like protein